MFGYTTTRNLYVCEIRNNDIVTYIIARRISDYIYRDYFSEEIYYYKNELDVLNNNMYVNYSSPIFFNKHIVSDKDIIDLLRQYDTQIKRKVKKM